MKINIYIIKIYKKFKYLKSNENILNYFGKTAL